MKFERTDLILLLARRAFSDSLASMWYQSGGNVNDADVKALAERSIKSYWQDIDAKELRSLVERLVTA